MERDIHGELTGADLWIGAMGEGKGHESPLGEVVKKMLRSAFPLPWREAFRQEYREWLTQRGVSLEGVRVMPWLNGSCGWFIHPEEPTAAQVRERFNVPWALVNEKEGPWQKVFFVRRSGGWHYRHPIMNARASALEFLTRKGEVNSSFLEWVGAKTLLEEGDLGRFGVVSGNRDRIRLEPNEWAKKVVARYNRHLQKTRENKNEY